MFGSKKTEEERQADRLRKEQEREERRRQQEQQRHREQAERAERREQRKALAAERSARRTATTVLPQLGVAVRDGQVYKHDMGVAMGREGGTVLGPLAGARADVTGGRAGHRRSAGARTADTALAVSVLGPAGLLAAASRKGTRGTAFVVFANGKLHERHITDADTLVRAQADAVRFNALADADLRSQLTSRPTVETPNMQAANGQVRLCPGCGQPIVASVDNSVPFVHSATGQFAC